MPPALRALRTRRVRKVRAASALNPHAHRRIGTAGDRTLLHSPPIDRLIKANLRVRNPEHSAFDAAQAALIEDATRRLLGVGHMRRRVDALEVSHAALEPLGMCLPSATNLRSAPPLRGQNAHSESLKAQASHLKEPPSFSIRSPLAPAHSRRCAQANRTGSRRPHRRRLSRCLCRLLPVHVAVAADRTDQ